MKAIELLTENRIFLLADVLTALEPLLPDFLFWIGDYEPGWWTSPEARAWVTLNLDANTTLPHDLFPLLLTFENTMYFARSSLGMCDYEVRLAHTPSDLRNNTWQGYLCHFGRFEVCMSDPALLDEAERLLNKCGFETGPIQPFDLFLVQQSSTPTNLREQMTHLVKSWDDEA